MARMRMGPLGYSFECLNDKLWDETGRTAISLTVVSYDQCAARSIQFGFIENGDLVTSKTYGSSSDCSRRVIRLNHETEFVTGISGELHGIYISSLAFHTNLRAHQSFHLNIVVGEKECPPKKVEFHSGILDRREFEGFFGLFDDDQLISINFDVRYILPDVKTIKKEKEWSLF